MIAARKEERMRNRAIPALAGGALAAAALGLTWACASAPNPSPGASPGASAKAAIESKSGSNVKGSANFTEQSTGGVKVEVRIENAPPGTHGLHIHEKGDCSAPDASSAGGHFNPAGMPHAGPSALQRHAGDLGNIEIESNGTGTLVLTSDLLTVKPGPNSVVGKAVVFHEKADDLTTQPTGDAGGRLGCGVIQ
jgi:Cu-Zn family superoxide dismutase